MNDLGLRVVDVDGYFAIYKDVTSLSIRDGVVEITYGRDREDSFLLSMISSIAINVDHIGTVGEEPQPEENNE